MDDAEPQANRLESLALTSIFSLISVGLLASIGYACKWGPESAGWWTRPALAPGMALAVLVIANLITLWREITDLRATPPTTAERTEARAKIMAWALPLEFLFYFAVYLWVLHHLGYFLSTLLFILGLMVRVRLTSPRWLITGALTALALTAIFRMGLNVWMPIPELYSLFPDAMRKLATRWF